MPVLQWVAAALLWASWMLLCQFPIHMLQLESYQLPMFIKCLRRTAKSSLLPPLTIGLAGLIVGIPLCTVYSGIAVVCTSAAMIVVGMIFFNRQGKQPQKKPLVYTARIKRLLVAIAIVTAAVIVLPLLLALGPWGIVIWWSAATLLLPLWVLASALAMQPVEIAVKHHYINDARRILKSRTDLVIVGITGSFGKTSSKFILGTLLSEKYNVLVPPASYNTPMGVTKLVRESLSAQHEVFICEMGARYVGDIQELCAIARPKYGLITSIGKQHLETFKSLENIISTKYELIDALPVDGHAFFPADDGICESLYQKTTKPKTLFGVEKEGERLDMAAANISMGAEGCSFTLIDGNGESIHCTTRLLGQHNVQNIAGAAAVARTMGLTMAQIAAGIAKLQPVEHRLQMLPSTNGVIVIDDAFNSNPAGSKAALEVIAQFPGKKIVVTPGMVELGAEEVALNRKFGRYMAQTVNEAILVGSPERVQPMLFGLKDEGFDDAHIHLAANLDEATVFIGQLARYGDVVLFENDLPDNY